MKNIEVFFNPKTVAVIGATDRKDSVGRAICENLKRNWRGQRKLFFVNPFRKRILGERAYASVKAIKEEVDLAVIAVPKEVVRKVSQECVEKSVKGVIIISAGFGEKGKKGKELENAIISLFKERRIPVLGPNCLGVISPVFGFNASFSLFTPPEGEIAVLSQSGALIDSLIDLSKKEGLGFSHLVSYGNESDLGLVDFLHYLTRDRFTSVVMVYLEGLKDGREFIKALKSLSARKPVVILKGGKTTVGRKAAFSHTGALTTSEKIFSKAFKEGGAFEVETFEDLIVVARAFATKRFLAGRGLKFGILTNGGAVGVLVSDFCQKFKIPLSSDSPLDLRGDATPEHFRVATENFLKRKDIGGVIVCQTPQPMTYPEKNARIFAKLQRFFPKKPIIALFLGEEKTKRGIEILRKNSIITVSDPREAALVCKGLIFLQDFVK